MRARNLYFERVTRALAITGMTLLLTADLRAQTQYSGLHGQTHPGEAGGVPAGSLLLGANDSISPFSGKLSYRVPLLSIGGRGSAGYTMTLNLQQQWRMTYALDYSLTPAEYRKYPSAAWWEPIDTGYGPGVMIRRDASWSLSAYCGAFPQYTLTRFTFSDPDGTEHTFRDVQYDGEVSTLAYSSAGGCSATGERNRGRIFKTFDGSAMTFISDFNIVDSKFNEEGHISREVYGFMFLPNGTRYRIARGVVDWIADRNGNMTRFEYEQTLQCDKCRVSKIRDPLNRLVSIAYVSDTNPVDTITYRGYGATPTKTIVVSYGLTAQSSEPPCNGTPLLYRGYTIKPINDPSKVSLFGGSEIRFSLECGNMYVVSAVRLANNDTYSFQYNDYGELAKVLLPTGGGYVYEHEGGFGETLSYSGNFIYRRLKTKKEFTSQDTAGVETFSGITQFEYTTAFDAPTTTVKITRRQSAGSAILSQTVHTYKGSPLNAYNDSSISYAPSDEGMEVQADSKDKDGNVLRQVTNVYAQRQAVSWWAALTTQEKDNRGQKKEPPNDLRLTETSMIANPGPSQKAYRQTFGYDEYNNRETVREFDFDTTTELRRTVTTFLKSYGSPAVSYDGTGAYNPGDTNIAGRVKNVYHIRNVPRQVSIFEGTCEVARTVSEFDEATPTDRTDVTGRVHNNPYLGSELSFSTPPFTFGVDPFGTTHTRRANVTKVSKAVLYNATGTQCLGTNPTMVATTQTYDILGNVISVTDARSNTTTISYADHFLGDTFDKSASSTFAFATKVTNPKSQEVNRTINYNLGAAVSVTDANAQTVSLTWDALGRPDTVTLPDGGSRSFGYVASAGTVTTTVKRTATENLVTVAVFDGLGRPCETRTQEAGTSIIRTRTAYDGAGRASAQTNPQRLTTAPARCAVGTGETTTTTEYDALDRPKSKTYPDGSIEATEYLGETTTATDPAGLSRKLSTDALGRLAQVTEAPGTLGYQTYYKYDALGNLSGVCHGAAFASGACPSTSLARNFRYDSLSRLRMAENPESGPITLTYDDNGNLKTKTDTRPLTVTLNYDSLNRLDGKTYSDGTPAVAYCYDDHTTCGGTAVANAKGRLIQVNNTTSKTRIDGYDSMGRVTASTQTNGTGTGAPTFPFTSYTYDLAGNLLTTRYPSGRVVQADFDAAGRQSKVSNVVSTVVTPYAEVGAFGAHGGVESLKLGWNAAATPPAEVMTESWAYSPERLQPVETNLKLRGSSQNLLRLEYFYCTGFAASCSTNNGNMMGQKIGQDPVGTTAAWKRAQEFSYDNVSRLSMARERADAGTAWDWTQSYGYDQHGNRWVTVGPSSTTTVTQESAYWDASNKNTANRLLRRADGSMLAAGAYDGAGNLLTHPDFGTFAYDGEGRMVSASAGAPPIATTYAYDGNGRRVMKTVGAVRTDFVYDAFGRLVAEYGASAEAGTRYLTVDHLGSTRLAVDGSGAIAKCYDYVPFGEALTSGRPACYGANAAPQWPAADANRVQFTGQLREAETGLDYFGARYMSGAMGRFTSPDPFDVLMEAPDEEALTEFLAEPQGWNKYTYVTNKPLVATDPDGRNPRLLTQAGQWISQTPVGQAVGNSSTARWLSRNASWVGSTVERYAVQGYIAATEFAYSPTGQMLMSSVVEMASGYYGPSNPAAPMLKLTNIAAIDHSARHLIDAGIINAPAQSRAAREMFKEIASYVVDNAVAMRPFKVKSGEMVMTYVAKVKGKFVAIQVALEKVGKKKHIGDPIDGYVLNDEQLEAFGLK